LQIRLNEICVKDCIVCEIFKRFQCDVMKIKRFPKKSRKKQKKTQKGIDLNHIQV